MGKYVKVRDRPRPTTHPGTGGWEYFHWCYGQRFYRGCRVRVVPGPGMDEFKGKVGTVTSCDYHIRVRFPDQKYKTYRYPFHPRDLEILKDQSA